MKFLKTFESYSEPTDDMIILEEIYDEELYRSEISLKKSIDKMFMKLDVDFINKFNNDVRIKAFRFFEMEGDISKNENFIDWVKSLSDLDTQRLIDLVLEVEVYELIPFIKELRSFS